MRIEKVESQMKKVMLQSILRESGGCADRESHAVVKTENRTVVQSEKTQTTVLIVELRIIQTAVQTMIVEPRENRTVVQSERFKQ